MAWSVGLQAVVSGHVGKAYTMLTRGRAQGSRNNIAGLRGTVMRKTTFFRSQLIAALAVILTMLSAALAGEGEAKGPALSREKILVRGAHLHGANGVIFDKRDRLYIASGLGREILVMDPQTGRILDRLGPPEMDVGDPDDLIFGPDGSLYWTSILNGEVHRLSPDGVKTTQVVGPGINSITFSDNGRLFASQCLFGQTLFELDPGLSLPPRVIRDDLGPGCGLNAMDWFDGLLYGPRWFAGEVVRVNVDSGEVSTVVHGFGIAAAVKFDSRGRLHVVDSKRGEVVRVDKATGKKEVIAKLNPGLDNLAFDSRDRLFVSSFADGSITQILPGGHARTVSKGGMIAPGGVTVLTRPSGRERVFIADGVSVREFDGRTGKAGSVTTGFFGSIVGTPEIFLPMTVSSDGHDLILSSWRANAVQAWNPDSGEIVEEHLDFAVPMNAIRFQGDLVVAQLLTGSVIRRNATTGERVSLAAGLHVPSGLAATDRELWVADWATGTVWKIVDGVSLVPPIAVATGLSGPEGLAVEGRGRLLVVESSAGRLSRIDLATGEVSTVAEGLGFQPSISPNAPPTWNFNGVAVGRSGTIYVTGDAPNVLYRFRPDKNEHDDDIGCSRRSCWSGESD